MLSGSEQVAVLKPRSGPELPLVERGGSAHAQVWPGMGARMRSMHRVELRAGGATRELNHPSAAVYYVLAGAGEVRDEAEGSSEPLVEGSMIHVDPGTPYRLVAGEDGLDLVGGPAPADPALYGRAGEGR